MKFRTLEEEWEYYKEYEQKRNRPVQSRGCGTM